MGYHEGGRGSVVVSVMVYFLASQFTYLSIAQQVIIDWSARLGGTTASIHS